MGSGCADLRRSAWFVTRVVRLRATGRRLWWRFVGPVGLGSSVEPGVVFRAEEPAVLHVGGSAPAERRFVVDVGLALVSRTGTGGCCVGDRGLVPQARVESCVVVGPDVVEESGAGLGAGEGLALGVDLLGLERGEPGLHGGVVVAALAFADRDLQAM